MNLNALDQRIDQLGSKLPNFRVLSQTFQKHTQIDFVLLCRLKFPLVFSSEFDEISLLLLVIGSHLHKTLVGDLAGDVCLKQPLNRLVNGLYSSLARGYGLFQLLNIRLPCGIAVFSRSNTEIRTRSTEQSLQDCPPLPLPLFPTLHFGYYEFYKYLDRNYSWRSGRTPDWVLSSLLRNSCTRSNNSSEMIGSRMFGIPCCSSMELYMV